MRGQDSLFGGLTSYDGGSLELVPGDTATQAEKLLWEKELLGLYVSGHPLERCRAQIEQSGMHIGKIRTDIKNGMPVILGAMITAIKTVTTKNNDTMLL